MNNLEEISLNEEVLGREKCSQLTSKISRIMPKLQKINKMSSNIEAKFTQNMDHHHKALIDQIYHKSSTELSINQKFLHEVIEKERVLNKKNDQLMSGEGEIVTNNQVDEKKNELIQLQSKIIKDIENLDFTGICTVKENKENKLYFQSFNRIWIWILEMFFSRAASFYHWPDFMKKALKKDLGKELKRRMIIYNYKSLKFSELNELAELVAVHTKVVLEKFGETTEGLNDFIRVLKNILKYKEQSDVYEQMKDNVVEDSDVKNVREEYIKQTKNKLQLCSIKYDVLSEMNNYLSTVVRELKP